MPSITRRRTIAALGAAVTATSLAGCTAGGCTSGDIGPVRGRWPMDGGDPGHTGHAPGAAGPRSGTSVGWCFEAPIDGSARSVHAPAVARGKPSTLGGGDLASDGNGAVFVATTVRSTPVSRNHYLHTLDAASGEEHHRIPLRGEPNGSPAVTDDAIVVSQRSDAERSQVAAFDRGDGAHRWSHEVDGRVTAPPTVADDLIYVADWSGGIVALDLEGAVRWQRTIERGETHASFWGPPAAGDGTLYLAMGDVQSGLWALDASDGSEQWTLPHVDLRSDPVLAGGRLLALGDSSLLAFDPRDGTLDWSANVDPDVRYHRTAVDDSRAYVGAGGRLLAVRLDDGEIAWAVDLDDRFAGRPAVGAETVYAPARSGLNAYDAASGEHLWRLDRARGTPALAGGALFVPGADGRLLAAVECRGWLC